MSIIGEPLQRVDGRLKVTGGAKYSAEFAMPNLAYAVVLQSTIPSGRVASMDTAEAEHATGVLAVMTPANAPKLAAPLERISTLQDDKVHYNNQPIGIVVAESLHQAYHAASLVIVKYEKADEKLDFKAGFSSGYPGHHNEDPGDASWGDADEAFKSAEVKVEKIYTTPIQHHCPMEPHATIAQWDGDHLTLHDSTQNISGQKNLMAKMFGVPDGNVHVISWFVGGGFGCKGSVWSHVPLAAMAARKVNRPVKLVLERPQMFGPVGARPETYQQVSLGATREGKLTAIRHHVYTNTSFLEDYLESSAVPTRRMYACDNVSTVHRLVKLNMGTPTYMRAPGVATGTFALEVAMDELAYELKMDPLQLRLLNYTEVDPQTKKPFSEKHLRECYTQAAEKFGWSKRKREPRSMKESGQLIGWGMATETYPANRFPAEARVSFLPSGRVLVESGTHELGTGMYTVLTQVTADALGIAPELVDARLGDTNLPVAPISAGSRSTASVTPAVQDAAEKARLALIAIAVGDAKSPVHGAAADEVDFKDGKLFKRSAPGSGEKFTEVIARNGNRAVEGLSSVKPTEDKTKYSSHSFGAVFAEVSVDPQLGSARVRKVVAVYDVGRVVNRRLARSQFIGGIVWGIGLALHEDTLVDWRNGRIANANLAEYHVPVNLDVPEIDVLALDIPDTKLNPLGARGIGEIGITGTGAAIANAIYHATGKRVRELPITPDKLSA